MPKSIELRPYQSSDRSFFLGLVKNQDRMRFMDGALSDSAAESLFQSLLPGQARSHSAWLALHNDAPVGHGAIVETGEATSPEILFMVSQSTEGQGFATLIALELLKKAVRLGLEQLWASVDEDHLASQAVLKKAQFQIFRRVDEDPTPFIIYQRDLSSFPK
ncbi:MAG: GNAT family N-acetyltransferase [Planctomycetota bacterium]|nr:GNAT family N-acetyltransferase [Planctomycetota bacterium]